MKQLKNIDELPVGTLTLVDSKLLGENFITRQMMESWETERTSLSLARICLQVDYHWDEEWFDFKFFLSSDRIPSQADFYFKEGVFRIPVSTFEDGLDILYYFVNQWKYDNLKESIDRIDSTNLPENLFPLRWRFNKKLAQEIKNKGCPGLTLSFLQRILLEIS